MGRGRGKSACIGSHVGKGYCGEDAVEDPGEDLGITFSCLDDGLAPSSRVGTAANAPSEVGRRRCGNRTGVGVQSSINPTALDMQSDLEKRIDRLMKRAENILDHG